jgi:23S rRNA (guanosine2251-2'-O)-methyltransferase
MAPPQSLGEGEELVAGRPARRLLVVPQRRAALEKLVLHATNLRIPIVEVEGGSLTALAGFDGHQGIALVVEPRRYAGLDDILARAATRGEPPFVLVLDSLEDPHNVGSLLRSAEAAGVHGVIFPTHRQAPLSPSAIKASAGAVEHLLLCPVDDLAGALSDLHVRGVRIAGAEGDAPMTARESDLRGPLAIVVGSEGQGLGPAVRRRCDMFMRIPMRGAVGSLNAAVAGSILLFEAVAQRDMERADGSPPAPTEAPAKAKPKRATKATAAVAPPATTEAPAKAKPKRATKATAAVAPPAPTEAPAKAKPKRATKATAAVAPPAAAEAPAKAKPRRIAKTTASAAPAAPVKPKRAARPKPAANDVPTAPDDGESDLLPD